MNKYTIFILKKDALARGLRKNILKYIEKYYEIVMIKDVFVTKEMMEYLRKDEWKKNWNIYPSSEIKKYCFLDQVGKAVAILGKIKVDKDAISFGKKLRGTNPIAHLCDPESIRGKYADKSILNKIKIDNKSKIGYLCNKKGEKIRFVPNIIHAVSNKSELKIHLKIFFKDINFDAIK